MLVTRPTLCYGCFLVGPGHICHDLSPCQMVMLTLSFRGQSKLM